MFIIFGWGTTSKALEQVLSTTCMHCKNNSTWSIWKETEWVTLFFVKVLPLFSRHYLACDICADTLKLSAQTANAALTPKARTQELHDDIVRQIEQHQCHGLTERQIHFRKNEIERNQ